MINTLHANFRSNRRRGREAAGKRQGNPKTVGSPFGIGRIIAIILINQLIISHGCVIWCGTSLWQAGGQVSPAPRGVEKTAGEAQTLCCLAVVRFSVPLGAVSRPEGSKRSTPAPQATAAGGAGVDGRKRGANLLLWAAAQPYPAATSRTGRAFVDELDSRSLKSGHDPRQTFDYPTDRAVACFHSLNRRERYP